MITLLSLAALMIIGALVVGTIGVGFVLAFADVLVAVLIVYGVYWLFSHDKKKKESNKG